MMDDEHLRQHDISTKRKPMESGDLKENNNNQNLKKNIVEVKPGKHKIYHTDGDYVEQEQENMRKMRKEIGRKLEINIDDRSKEVVGNSLKTPVSHNDRKNSKLKHSKSKSKRL